MYKLLTILIIAFTEKLDAARILAVFPTPSISHQVVFRPLTQELARRGHQVTVITTDPVFEKGNTPENLTEIDVHDISYDKWKDVMFVNESEYGRHDSHLDLVDNTLNSYANAFEEQLKTKDVQDIISNKNVKFDLLLLEACYRTALVLSHIYDVPVIQISSFGMSLGSDEIVGAPTHPLLYSTLLHQRLYNLTVSEKINELYKHFYILKIFGATEIREHNQFKNIIGDDLPKFDVLKSNVDMLFLNIHPIWLDNQPLPSNVIPMWGIHKRPENELPQDLKDYLDSSKNGVIYLSFGSNVPSSNLPPEIIQTFNRVFSLLPYNVLWKWEKEELPGQPKNVRISKWFPQSDVLRHPNIKLFITHGGLQSTEETINAGVPVIGIPMFGDQWYNVEKYVYHKIGDKLYMDTLDDEQLKMAIIRVSKDKRYKENILRLRTLLKEQSQCPLDLAVWWTEYVLRHGGAKHIRTPAANMSWMEYYEIQFIVTLIFLIIVLGLVLFVFVCFLWNYMLQNFISNTKAA